MRLQKRLAGISNGSSMMNLSRRLSTIVAVGSILMLVTGTVGAEQDLMYTHDDDDLHNQEFTVGKNGEVKIRENVAMGNVLVDEGRYILSHRVEANNHILLLTRIDSKKGTKMETREIRTRLKTSAKPAQRSTLFAYQLANRSYRIAVVTVAGEDWDHLIP